MQENRENGANTNFIIFDKMNKCVSVTFTGMTNMPLISIFSPYMKKFAHITPNSFPTSHTISLCCQNFAILLT
jgi:hypothetical protein